MKEPPGVKKPKQRGPFVYYGWIIVLVSFLTVTLVYGTRYSFSVFYPALLDEFGWDRASTAAIFSVNLITYGLIAPVVGGLTDRFGPRRIIASGCLLVVVGAWFSSQAGQIWHLYLSFGILMGLGLSFAGYPPHVPILAKWFPRRRATALGIGLAGIGISYLFAPIVQYLISVTGWRNAYAILALIVLVVAMPLVLIFQRAQPKEIAIQPDIERQATVNASVQQHPPPFEWTLSLAMKTPQLWLIFCASFLSNGVGLGVVLAHQVLYAVDVGYSPQLAASVFGSWGIAYAVGLACGFLGDLIDRKKVYALCCIFVIIAMVMLIWAGDGVSPWKLYLYAVPLGLGTGLSAPTFASITAGLFAGTNFGRINAFTNALSFGLGGGIGPWVAGFIFDMSQSYLFAFILSMLSWAVAALCVWLAATLPTRTAHLKE